METQPLLGATKIDSASVWNGKPFGLEVARQLPRSPFMASVRITEKPLGNGENAPSGSTRGPAIPFPTESPRIAMPNQQVLDDIALPFRYLGTPSSWSPSTK
jgi:hypothetical protein